MDFQLDPTTSETIASIARICFAGMVFAIAKRFLWDKN